MKDSSPVYWKTRNGKLISVDDMDINHLRNVLKMIIRNRAKAIDLVVTKAKPTAKFTLNGDIAQDFVEQQILEEMQEDCEDCYTPF